MIKTNLSLHQGQFHWGKKVLPIICPQPGNLLQRIHKKSKKSKFYVVSQVTSNSKGRNSSIANNIYLDEVYHYDHSTDHFHYLKQPYSLILILTTAGNWFNKNLREKYEWQWLTEIPSLLQTQPLQKQPLQENNCQIIEIQLDL